MQNKILNKTLIILVLCSLIFGLAICSIDVNVASADSEISDTWYYGTDGLNILAAKQAVSGWDLTKLDKNDPVVIAVVDTGIHQNHEAFQDVLMKSTVSENQIIGYNAYSNENGEDTNKITDSSTDNHGTSVAGAIATLINEFGLQDYIKIIPIRATDDSSNSFKIDVISNALEWCYEKETIDIVNLSLGIQSSATNGTKWSTDARLLKAVSNLTSKAVIVAAAGNNSKNSASDTFYPAALDGVISVMNYGQNGDLYSTSNYGDAYTLAAPGEKIYTAYESNGLDAYKNVTGTSMAAPIVSFGAALLKLRLRIEGVSDDASKVSKIISKISYPSFTTKDTLTISKFDLKTIATGSIDTKTYVYDTPTEIKVTNDGTSGTGDYEDYLYMKLSNVTPINFTAMVLPYGKVDPDLEGLLEWVEIDSDGNEKVLGKGLTFTYTPTNGGAYKIVARLKYADNKVLTSEEQVYIEFGQYYVENVKVTYADQVSLGKIDAPSNGLAYVKDTVSFSLTGIEYVDKSVDIKWYVNDEYVTSGVVFNYTPTDAGTYKILAKYGDRGIIDNMAFTLTVKPNIERPLYLGLLIGGCVLAAIIVCVIVLVCVRKSKIKAKIDLYAYNRIEDKE